MLIQFNADHHVRAHQDLVPNLEAELETALARFAPQITRVEVYLQDTNGGKAGANDKRCTLETRMSGYDPVAVHHEASTVPAAFHGARDKLVRFLDKRFDRLRHPKAHDRETHIRDNSLGDIVGGSLSDPQDLEHNA